MNSGSTWTEAENVLLRRLTVQAIPDGIYSEEPPLLEPEPHKECAGSPSYAHTITPHVIPIFPIGSPLVRC
jgi:hypothetical protein